MKKEMKKVINYKNYIKTLKLNKQEGHLCSNKCKMSLAKTNNFLPVKSRDREE